MPEKIGDYYIDFTVNDGKGKQQLNQLDEQMSKTAKKQEGMFNILKSGWASVATGVNQAIQVFQQVGRAVKDFIQDWVESERIMKATEAVIKSTGGAAGLTAKEIGRMASEFQNATAFEDEEIQGGQNLLLTFTRIGKDVFPQATEAMLDMSTAMGTDLKSSAIQLGKALNDPAEGAVALRRVGVSLTDQQMKQIKAFQESGDILSAQKIILKELQTEFGGMARAMKQTTEGALKSANNAWGDLKETIGEKLAPAIRKGAQSVEKFSIAAKEIIDPTQKLANNTATLIDLNKQYKDITDKLTFSTANLTIEQKNLLESQQQLIQAAMLKTVMELNKAFAETSNTGHYNAVLAMSARLRLKDVTEALASYKKMSDEQKKNFSYLATKYTYYGKDNAQFFSKEQKLNYEQTLEYFSSLQNEVANLGATGNEIIGKNKESIAQLASYAQLLSGTERENFLTIMSEPLQKKVRDLLQQINDQKKESAATEKKAAETEAERLARLEREKQAREQQLENLKKQLEYQKMLQEQAQGRGDDYGEAQSIAEQVSIYRQLIHLTDDKNEKLKLSLELEKLLSAEIGGTKEKTEQSNDLLNASAQDVAGGLTVSLADLADAMLTVWETVEETGDWGEAAETAIQGLAQKIPIVGGLVAKLIDTLWETDTEKREKAKEALDDFQNLSQKYIDLGMMSQSEYLAGLKDQLASMEAVGASEEDILDLKIDIANAQEEINEKAREYLELVTAATETLRETFELTGNTAYDKMLAEVGVKSLGKQIGASVTEITSATGQSELSDELSRLNALRQENLAMYAKTHNADYQVQANLIARQIQKLEKEKAAFAAELSSVTALDETGAIANPEAFADFYLRAASGEFDAYVDDSNAFLQSLQDIAEANNTILSTQADIAEIDAEAQQSRVESIQEYLDYLSASKSLAEARNQDTAKLVELEITNLETLAQEYIRLGQMTDAFDALTEAENLRAELEADIADAMQDQLDAAKGLMDTGLYDPENWADINALTQSLSSAGYSGTELLSALGDLGVEGASYRAAGNTTVQIGSITTNLNEATTDSFKASLAGMISDTFKNI